jgi:hypothetical protein
MKERIEYLATLKKDPFPAYLVTIPALENIIEEHDQNYNRYISGKVLNKYRIKLDETTLTALLKCAKEHLWAIEEQLCKICEEKRFDKELIEY